MALAVISHMQRPKVRLVVEVTHFYNVCYSVTFKMHDLCQRHFCVPKDLLIKYLYIHNHVVTHCSVSPHDYDMV